MVTGRINPDTDTAYPEIWIDGKLKTVGNYHSFAHYRTDSGEDYIVFSPYFEGTLPPDMVTGRVYRLVAVKGEDNDT